MNDNTRTHSIVTTMAWSLVAIVAAALVVVVQPQARGQTQAESLSVSFRRAVDRIRPAVVAIRPVDGAGAPMRPFAPGLGPFRPGEFGPRGFFRNDELGRGSSNGSGVVIDAERGFVLTADSNLRGASQVAVILSDGRERVATQIRRDSLSDLALLVVDLKGWNLAPAIWGDSSKLQVGDWLLTVGQPPGAAPAVSAGIFSARRAIAGTGYPDEFIETDATVSSLGSGGPLISTSGEVVGIALAFSGRAGALPGMGLAIPADQARRIAEELAQVGRVRRGYLGIEILPRERDSTEGGSVAGPVVVSTVTAGSPAAEAGLRPGDLIRRVGERPVTGVAMLRAVVAAAPIGQELNLTIERSGKALEVKVRPRELAGTPEQLPGASAPGQLLQPRRRALPGTRPALPAPGRVEPEPESLEPVPGRDEDGTAE
jgi:serine protease Do